MANYIPKKSFFEPTRVHKIAKDIIRDSREDRARALETFEFFKSLVSKDAEDDKSKAEMVNSLKLMQNANDAIVKVLDMMINMTQVEKKIELSKSKPAKDLSFEDLKKNV